MHRVAVGVRGKASVSRRAVSAYSREPTSWFFSPFPNTHLPQVFVTSDRFGFLRLKEEIEVVLMVRHPSSVPRVAPARVLNAPLAGARNLGTSPSSHFDWPDEHCNGQRPLSPTPPHCESTLLGRGGAVGGRRVDRAHW